MKKLSLSLVVLCVLGCQGAPQSVQNPIALINATSRVSLSDEGAVKVLLYEQLKEWRAVRYDYGGLSKQGVDCSGFVYLTYRSQFGIKLPRTAAQQATVGRFVTQPHLRPGDLVFFKTGRRARHVGIFLDERKFIHASKSRGVILSSLDDVYWSKKYWKAKRVGSHEPLAIELQFLEDSAMPIKGLRS